MANHKHLWQTILANALPVIATAAEQKIVTKTDDPGKDALIEFGFGYLSKLGEALLAGDTDAIQAHLNTVAPK